MNPKLIYILIQAIELYSYMMLIWVIGSWFPQLQSTGFYRFIDSIVNPYARIFRGIIPPMGGFDFSVIIAFFALGLAQKLISMLIVPL